MVPSCMHGERRRYTSPQGRAVFRPITAADLHQNAVAASCLDDQYIDRRTLLSKSFGFRQDYTKCVLQEFAKCLLSAEQVVVNRTYLQNTEVMRHLAPLDDASDDTAIVRLIDDGAIIPYLYSDDDPTLQASVASRALNADAVSAWNRVCERTEPQCLRLSWNNSTDAELRTDRLANRFSRRLEELAEVGRPDILRELTHQHSDAAVEAFGGYLRGVLLPIARDRPTRRQLYDELILRRGSNVADTEIDVTKPFACEIKQLIDLVYNANMAGALGINSVTPSRSVSADLLADAGLQPENGRTVSTDLAAAVAALALKMQREHYDESTSPILGDLSVEEVARIRDHSVWRRYVRSVADLNNIDGSLDDDSFYRTFEETFGQALAQSEALCMHLYKYHGAARQKRDRTRSLFAQAGSLCLGATIGTAVGLPFPSGILGSVAGNMAGGIVHAAVERPLRFLSMRVDLLGGTFAAWRLPDLRLAGGEATFDRFREELRKMQIEVAPIDPAALASPTIEAEVATL